MPAFLPARPITQVHLAALTERVRRRLILWFRRTQLLDAAAAAGWENSGLSIDASLRIALIDRKTAAEAPLTGLSLLIQALVLVRIRQELGTDSRFARALHDFVYALVSVWQ